MMMMMSSEVFASFLDEVEQTSLFEGRIVLVGTDCGSLGVCQLAAFLR